MTSFIWDYKGQIKAYEVLQCMGIIDVMSYLVCVYKERYYCPINLCCNCISASGIHNEFYRIFYRHFF